MERDGMFAHPDSKKSEIQSKILFQDQYLQSNNAKKPIPGTNDFHKIEFVQLIFHLHYLYLMWKWTVISLLEV